MIKSNPGDHSDVEYMSCARTTLNWEPNPPFGGIITLSIEVYLKIYPAWIF